jgi:hypothetical protein
MHGFDELELSIETIRELTGDELDLVAGGAQGPTLAEGCTTDVPTVCVCLTGIYPSINVGCTDTLLCR